MNIIDQEELVSEEEKDNNFRDTSHFARQKYPVNQSQIIFGIRPHRSSSIGE